MGQSRSRKDHALPLCTLAFFENAKGGGKALGIACQGRPVEIGAGWLLGVWVVLQLVEASLGSMSDVAVGAHLGGFALGAAGAAFMRSARCKGTGWYIDPRPPAGGRAAVDRLHRARA